MNYVIIGACAAGLSTAEAIRKADAKGNITMLTEEAYLPYSRPSISYFLKGKVKESDMALRKPAFYKANNIKSAKNHTLMINFALQQVQSLLFRQWKMLTVRIMQ